MVEYSNSSPHGNLGSILPIITISRFTTVNMPPCRKSLANLVPFSIHIVLLSLPSPCSVCNSVSCPYTLKEIQRIQNRQQILLVQGYGLRIWLSALSRHSWSDLFYDAASSSSGAKRIQKTFPQNSAGAIQPFPHVH
jgi:hypothetical protein